MKKYLLVILCLALVLTGCKKKEDIEYYDDTYEPPEVTEVERKNPTFEFSSVIRYEINDQILEIIDKKKFDAELVSVLQEDGLVPTKGTNVVSVIDGGYISTYFDGHYEFDLYLQTTDEPMIHCVVNGEEYSFSVYV